MPVVQAFAQEAGEQRRFQALARAVVATHQRNIRLTKFYSLGSGLITALSAAAILLIGAEHVLAGSLSLGSLLVFLSYLGLLQAQMKSLTGIYRKLQGASASVERLMELLEAEPEVRDRRGRGPCRPCAGTCAWTT